MGTRILDILLPDVTCLSLKGDDNELLAVDPVISDNENVVPDFLLGIVDFLAFDFMFVGECDGISDAFSCGIRCSFEEIEIVPSVLSSLIHDLT